MKVRRGTARDVEGEGQKGEEEEGIRKSFTSLYGGSEVKGESMEV
jgi:hypothetical protein